MNTNKKYKVTFSKGTSTKDMLTVCMNKLHQYWANCGSAMGFNLFHGKVISAKTQAEAIVAIESQFIINWK